MDTITHTLFGFALYGAVDKTKFTKTEKRALLTTTLIGSNLPDIDVISAWWDASGRYQMWHRGLTHSLFLVPVWAALLAGIVKLFFKTKGWLIFWMAMLAVFIHDTSDLFNAWGTGYLEPFSHVRISFGTIPIVDFMFWMIMLVGLVLSYVKKLKWRSSPIFKWVWVAMVLHVVIQTSQGYYLYQQAATATNQVALAADFIPSVFTVIVKEENEVVLKKGTVWTGLKKEAELVSLEEESLDELFEQNPKAQTLYEWSPFVVITAEGDKFGIYDPRFYRNGQSFLFEYIEKAQQAEVN